MGKMPQKRMECFTLLFDHLAWIEHQFLSDIRDSRKAGSLWGMMRGVAGVRKSIHQSWLAKVLGLQGSSGRYSVGRGQHSSNRLSGISSRTIHPSTTPFFSQTIWPRWASRQFHSLPRVQTLLSVTIAYSISSEAVVMRQLRRWKRLWRRLSDLFFKPMIRQILTNKRFMTRLKKVDYFLKCSEKPPVKTNVKDSHRLKYVTT